MIKSISVLYFIILTLIDINSITSLLRAIHEITVLISTIQIINSNNIPSGAENALINKAKNE